MGIMYICVVEDADLMRRAMMWLQEKACINNVSKSVLY